MVFESWENWLWASGFACHLILAVVLLTRRHWRRYPIFTLLMVYQVVRTVALYIVSIRGAEETYNTVYLVLAFGDYCLQTGLVLEMATAVLRPNGSWLPGTKLLFFGWSVVGAVLAVAVGAAAHPLSRSVGALWEARADLFTTVWTSELFLSLLFVSHWMRLFWGSRLMVLAEGLAVWCIGTFSCDVAFLLEASQRVLMLSDRVRDLMYLGVLLFWIRSFYVPKREEALSPDEFAQFMLDFQGRARLG